MNRSQLDLSQLAMDRSPSRETKPARPQRKRWVSRYVIPIGILVGFVMLLGAAAGRRLLPRQSVTVVPVIVKRSELQPSGTPLFQAAGWIEPRPTAIRVAALASGVIEELLVVEGQSVTKGDPIASLIAIDAELDVEQAKNLLAIREGELNRAIAERDAAKIRLKNPVHLQVPLAEAQSRLANAKTELAKLPFLIEAAQAQVKYTHSSMQGKQAAEAAIAGRIVRQSESEYTAANANLQELQQRGPHIQREVKALQGKVDALQQQLELLVEETRQMQEAEAKVASAIGLRNEAELKLRQTELTLQRNTVLAPMDGRILSLIASPGTRVTGLDGPSGQGSSTVVEMYDPERLQVRADVRLEDVPMVIRGQSVEIKTASSDAVIHGRVLQTTSSANIQKNTLEVKVELIDPPPNVSPEMLVTATFLSPTVTETADEMMQSERLFVPQQLIQSGDTGSFVWIVDFDQRAQQRSVDVGTPSAEGLIEVQSGLNVTDKLIATGLDDLQPGNYVTVTGEEQTIGK